MPLEWQVVHKSIMHTNGRGYEFEIYPSESTPFWMYITCHDIADIYLIDDRGFNSVEEAKQFAENWTPPCNECECNPCICTVNTSTDKPRVLTANHENEFVEPMQEFLAEKNGTVTVAINDEEPTQMWSGMAVHFLIGYISTYGEWSMEYSLLKNKVIGQVNTLKGAFQFSIERN
jgi:hypothetical protein